MQVDSALRYNDKYVLFNPTENEKYKKKKKRGATPSKYTISTTYGSQYTASGTTTVPAIIAVFSASTSTMIAGSKVNRASLTS